MLNQILFVFSVFIMGVLVSNLEASAESEIKEQIYQFVSAGDNQDPSKLETILHPDYRITFAFPGESKVTILTRETYLQLLKEKKLGGTKRSVKIEDIAIRGNTALVRAKLESEVMKFSIFFSLMNVGEGWKLISDLPYAEKKN